MTETTFDAAGFIKIDLAAGQMSSVASEQLAAVPVDVLASLAPGESLTQAAARWGHSHGTYFSSSSGGSPGQLQIDALANYLGGALAVMGLGNLSIEIHGAALVFRLTPSKGRFGAGSRALLGGFLNGFLRSISTHPFEVVSLGADTEDQMFWAGNPAAAGKMNTFVAQGLSPIDALSELTGEES